MRLAISSQVPHPHGNHNVRVPHLRDGLIVAKVGEAAIPLRESF